MLYLLAARIAIQLTIAPVIALMVVRITLLGHPAQSAALVQSAVMTGLLVGAIGSYRIIHRLGYRPAFTTFCALIAGVVALFPFLSSIATWMAVGAVMGVAAAALTVLTETWLHGLTANDHRGRIMGLYILAGQFAAVLGMAATAAASPLSMTPFLIFALIVTLAALPVRFAAPPAVSVRRPRGMIRGAALLLSRRPWPIFVIVVGGALTGMQFGMLAVYVTQQTVLTVAAPAVLALLLVGGMLIPYPLGLLSDRLGRTFTLCMTSVALAATSMTLVYALESLALFLTCIVLLGGLASAIYPQGSAIINDDLPEDTRTAVNGGLMFSYSLGLLMGPVPAALVMETFGHDALFVLIASTCTLLLVGCVGRGLVSMLMPRTGRTTGRRSTPAPGPSDYADTDP
ncbi:MAG: MFS transporter [Alphaproteobacteria bacterium]